MEMARSDSSIAIFFGVHKGLPMGSIYLGGSEEQKQKWLPPLPPGVGGYCAILALGLTGALQTAQ
jgi:alkylation response protein AidB-like acyl-CoA dehydrogenase